MSDYIKSQYHIDLCIRQCQRLFHELGFSQIRPQTYPSLGEPNEEEREAYKKIADLANNPNAILVFQDEVHYTVQTGISSMWAVKGSKPKVKSYPGKDKISYSGFVIPSTGKLFTCKPEWFDYETTIKSIRDFLKTNPAQENCKYYLVMDNAPWHKKAKRLIKENFNQEYSDISDKVIFVYLPPYSPDLNPIEQVWRLTRCDAAHNIFFRDVHKLEQAVDDYYSLFTVPNIWLKSLCSFNFDH